MGTALDLWETRPQSFHVPKSLAMGMKHPQICGNGSGGARSVFEMF
jgi:hypothetical protein